MAKATKETDKEVKKTQIAMATERLEKLFGIGIIIGGGNRLEPVSRRSTGSIRLDNELGGGLPRGRVIDITGPESSGKTTICYHSIKVCQDAKEISAYIDMEHAADVVYMQKLGIDTDALLISQPMFGESALEIVHQLVKTNEVRLIVVDSVASLVPKSEVDGEIGDSKMAGIARLMSQSLRVLTPLCEANDCTIIFCNQIRLNPGGMGNPETPPGGNALRFYASVRLDLRRVENNKEKEITKTKIKVVKSKVSKPFGEVIVPLVWGDGFSRIEEIIDIALEYKIMSMAGAGHYSYGETKLGQGKDTIIELFKNNVEFLDEIECKCIEALKGQ